MLPFAIIIYGGHFAYRRCRYPWAPSALVAMGTPGLILDPLGWSLRIVSRYSLPLLGWDWSSGYLGYSSHAQRGHGGL